MKATGIVRRVDSLGQVVIPKEIRRALKIKEGDPLEIYTARDGSVIIKPYHKDWEICILEWHNNNRERLNHPSHKYHEMGDFTICVLNDKRIGIGNVNSRLDNSGADENVYLAREHLAPYILKLLLVHLSVGYRNSRLGYLLG